MENITATEMEAIKSYTWFDDYEHHRKYLTGGNLERAALKRELGAKEYKRISTEAEKLNKLFVKYKDGAQNQIIHRGLAVKDWQYEFVKSKYKTGDIAKVGDGISQAGAAALKWLIVFQKASTAWYSIWKKEGILLMSWT